MKTLKELNKNFPRDSTGIKVPKDSIDRINEDLETTKRELVKNAGIIQSNKRLTAQEKDSLLNVIEIQANSEESLKKDKDKLLKDFTSILEENEILKKENRYWKNRAIELEEENKRLRNGYYYNQTYYKKFNEGDIPYSDMILIDPKKPTIIPYKLAKFTRGVPDGKYQVQLYIRGHKEHIISQEAEARYQPIINLKKK